MDSCTKTQYPELLISPESTHGEFIAVGWRDAFALTVEAEASYEHDTHGTNPTIR